MNITNITLSDNTFNKLSTIIKARVGIVLETSKKQMIINRLIGRLLELNLSDIDQYYEYLSLNESELNKYINSMTTNFTSFFREKHHFDFLRETIMPGLLKKTEPLLFWSAATSTGEEPYSLVITLLESNILQQHPGFKILATDIDTQVLIQAKDGLYRQDKITSLCDSLRKKYFNQTYVGSKPYLKIKDRLKKNIAFKQLNLLNAWPMKKQFHCIFCRNVLIYFDRKTQDSIIERLHGSLHSGGYLFLGHTESLGPHENKFEHLGKTIFRKSSCE